MSVTHSIKVLVVSRPSLWRDSAARVLQERLGEDDTVVTWAASLEEAVRAVRCDPDIRYLLIRDNHDERGVLTAMSRMIMVQPAFVNA